MRLVKVKMNQHTWVRDSKTELPVIFGVWELLVLCTQPRNPVHIMASAYSCTREEVIEVLECLKGFMHPKEVARYGKSFDYTRKNDHTPSKFL